MPPKRENLDDKRKNNIQATSDLAIALLDP